MKMKTIRASTEKHTHFFTHFNRIYLIKDACYRRILNFFPISFCKLSLWKGRNETVLCTTLHIHHLYGEKKLHLRIHQWHTHISKKKWCLQETFAENKKNSILFIIWLVFQHSNGNCNQFQSHIFLIWDYLYKF